MTRHVIHSRLFACSLLLVPVLVGCDDSDPDPVGIDGGPDAGPDGSVPDGSTSDGQVILPDGAVAVVGDTWGYTSGKRLVKFQRATGKVELSVAVAGLGEESVVGVDIRPANGAVTVLTNLALYTLDPQTGVLGSRLTLSADPTDTSEAFSGAIQLATVATPPVAITYGLDFNPIVDRLRVVSSTGANLRINPNNGLVITDPAVSPVTPITAAAYSNNIAADCGTKLYVIDGTTRQVLVQDLTTAVLTEPKSLGDATIGQVRGFDITTSGAGENVAVVAATATDGARVYELNLATGALGTPHVVALPAGEVLESVFAAVPVPSGELLGTTISNKLITFNRVAPGKLCTNVAISGLDSGDEVLAAAVRPADKTLYGVTRNGKLIKIAVPSGVASGALELSAAEGATFTLPLSGTDVGMSFNPVVDRLRLVTDTAVNLRINPADGKVTVDSPITAAAAPPLGQFRITEVAYTNPTGALPATSTTLWAIDSEGDQLVRIGAEPADAAACPNATNPNCGVYTVVKALGFGSSNVNGFDVEPSSGTVLAALTAMPTDTTATLYRINPAGDATATPQTVSMGLGVIGGAELLRSLSFAPKP